MNIITVASRKVGSGKTTLTAHLAACAQAQGRRCLVIDADPRGALCDQLCAAGVLPLATAERGIGRALATATGCDWVLIDTAATMWVAAQEAIRIATLVVIPARPGFLELAAVRATAGIASARDKPYAVVFNAAPPKHDLKEAPVVAESRAFLERYGFPVWSGQISARADLALVPVAGAADTRARTAAEIMGLWMAIDRSVAAVNAARAGASGVPAAAA